MRHTITACTVSALALLAPAIATAQDTTTQAASETATEADFNASTVLVRVNDTDITLGHVIVMLSKLPANYLELPDDVLFPGVLDQLINQSLLGEDALAANDGEPLEVRLAVENERRGLLAAARINEIAAQPVAEEAVVAAYEELYSNLPAETEYNASHILVETEEEAQALVSELEGGADFAELAREKSTGPSGPGGGSLGWFGLGQMVPEFETAVVELEAEQVSAPVKTDFGWHVIRLNETRIKPVPSLEETRASLVPELQQRAVEELVESLRAKANIETVGKDVPASAMRDRALLFVE